jgi:hypothetical protein
VTTVGGLEYFGRQSWNQQVKFGETYSEVIQVNIPPNDTCALIIRIGRPEGGRSRAVAYFVSFDDTVEFWKGSPIGATPRNKMTFGETRIAELTPEQRAQVLDWEVSLKGVWSKKLKFVLPLLGKLTPTKQDSVFHIRISRETYWKLYDRGIRPEWLKPPPR